jgi:hypothetical protein
MALAVALVLLASCATKPPTPEPTPAPVVETKPEPAPTPVVTPPPAAPSFDKAALDKLRDETLALRKHSFDLGIADVLPGDYAKADEAYTLGASAYDKQNWQASLDSYTTAKQLFTDLLPKGLAALVDRAKSRADEARKTAVTAGADANSDARLGAGDKAYAAARAAGGPDTIEASLGTWELSRALFELSGKHAKALGLQALVQDKSYAVWDKGNADTAVGKLNDENALFAAESGAKLDTVRKEIDLIDEVILRYNLVVAKGRESIALDARGKSDASKSKSQSIKAEVAVKAEFTKASDAYAAAAAALADSRFEDAAAGFANATSLFDAAYSLASDKRQAALDAMKAAEAAQAASMQNAQKADSLLGATSGTP